MLHRAKAAVAPTIDDMLAGRLIDLKPAELSLVVYTALKPIVELFLHSSGNL